MRFASLGSGSEGNGLLVSAGTGSSCRGAGQTLVMMDCGFGLHDTIARLASLGVSPEQLGGIIVTHEHGDHIGGVVRLARKFNLPVWLTHGTLHSRKNLAGIAHLMKLIPSGVRDRRDRNHSLPGSA